MPVFLPGASGNPRGRPKGSGGKRSRLRRLKTQLEELSPAAIRKVAELLHDPEGKPMVQLPAAKLLIQTYIDLHSLIIEEEMKMNPGSTPGDDEDDETAKPAALLSLTVVS